MKQSDQRPPDHQLRKLLELTRCTWDVPTSRPSVRKNFRKVCACRTPALGGEVYASDSEERVFYHTCKSRCCPSCGNRGTQLWQREQWAMLPDIPFVGVVLTMPDVLWPIFRAHRHLQHDLPALGAAVLEQWARSRYGVKICIIVVPHTFGGRLNHNPHLHTMISAGGLHVARGEWIRSLELDPMTVMELWRFAVLEYLKNAQRRGLIRIWKSTQPIEDVLAAQEPRKWNIHITRQMRKEHFLRYAGRYIRRLPISQRRILAVHEEEVTYQEKNTRARRHVERRSTPGTLVSLLSEHVPDHYRHSMRYFGLLAPRTKHNVWPAIFMLLKQQQRPRPARLSWRVALQRYFQADPLRDSGGGTMRWSRRIRAKPDPNSA